MVDLPPFTKVKVSYPNHNPLEGHVLRKREDKGGVYYDVVIYKHRSVRPINPEKIRVITLGPRGGEYETPLAEVTDKHDIAIAEREESYG